MKFSLAAKIAAEFTGTAFLADTFAGIGPVDAPLFITAQLAGALTATFFFRWLVPVVTPIAD